MSAAASLALRPPFSFTFHATERFRARVWPTINPGRPCADAREALTILRDAATRAELAPRRTDLGHAVWSVADPAMRWITRPDTFRGRRVAVVVTVLSGAEDVAAEEEAERDVLEAARRLAAAPEVGPEETTSAPPGDLQGAALKAYRAWVALEMQRLAVERKRTSRISIPQPPKLARCGMFSGDLERERLQNERMRLAAEQHEAARRERTARHLISNAHEALFLELVSRLEAVDREGSADLIARARDRVAKWEAEGRMLRGETT